MRPTDPHPLGEAGPSGWLIAALALPGGGLLALDLWSDLRQGGGGGHVLMEATAIGGLVVAVWLLWAAEARRNATRVLALRAEVSRFRAALEALAVRGAPPGLPDELEAERSDRRVAPPRVASAEDAPEGASAADRAPAGGAADGPRADWVSVVDARFAGWALTPAEQEVAWLLIKGVSFKDIGAARRTSPRTARDQAGAIYRKARVSGRPELAALLLDISAEG
jgi:DNA-binding CsgD family transcriptional regulator